MTLDSNRRERGFSLVELTVVLLVISVLMTIGMASYARMAHIADDEAVQLELVFAAKVQMLQHLENGVFSADSDVLRALGPSLRYSADGADRTIVVVVDPAHDTSDVCLFGHANPGEWFAVHYSPDSGIRYAESAPLACTPANVAGWSAAPW